MRKGLATGAISASLMVLITLLPATPVAAAQTLAQVQAQVIRLEEEATTAAEGAQEAKVKLTALTRSLAGIQAQAALQAKTVDEISKVLGTIAVNQYKSGTLSQSLELLFSTDPTLYLSSAGSLEAITRRKSTQLRKFQTAELQLNATSLTVADRLAQVKALEKKLAERSAYAQRKLAQAEVLLSKLKKEDRERLARLAEERENADQQSSLQAAKSAVGLSGRSGIALKYALQQIGDRYVFGADGMTTWDCSGLTMRAFRTAGVSLPHSSKTQYGYGKAIARKDLQRGDLV